MNKEFLFEMLKTPSPSGGEITLQKKIMKYTQEFHHNTDFTGNLITSMNNESPFRVLLAGHVDEIAYMVSDITSKGFVKVVGVGGIRHQLAQGRRVQILGKETILGTFGIAAGGKPVNTDAKTSDLYIDTGYTQEELLKKIAVGDYVVYLEDVTKLGNNRIAARALDNRLGAFIVTESLKRAKEKGAEVGIYSATTVGEESTMRGAFWAAENVQPNLAIVIDVTFTCDYPGQSPHNTGDIALDKGPVLAKGSIINDVVNKDMANLAKKMDINIQYEVAPGRTGTDGDRIHMSSNGVPVVLVSIPLRYMHSPSEVCSLNDVEEIIELVSEFLANMSEEYDIDPFN